MSLGLDATGRCRCSRCWRHRHATTSDRDAGTRGSPTGPGKWSYCCAAGCPTGPWCWWATTATPSWIYCTAASPLREPVTLIARLRLDAALYAPAPIRQPGQNGRPALKGPRRPSLKSLLDQGPCGLDYRCSGLVQRHHPHRGTHLPDRRLVPARGSRPYPSAGC